MTSKKRNITIIAVLLCVCAAVYLNWSYNKQGNKEDAFADGALAGAKSAEELPANGADAYVSDYFAAARLTRQQSRDEALALLETASTSDTASQETIDGAMNSIAAMASYSMQETQIENLLLAKNFSECLAFMSGEGITLAVPAAAGGLTADQVAKITDAIIAETNFTATQIKIIEVRAPVEETNPTKTDTNSGGVVPDAGGKTDTVAGAEGLNTGDVE